MRASVLVLGPLLAKMAEQSLLPGGCAIGARPINLHIMGLKKMGAKSLFEGYIERAKRLGSQIYFDIPTVTGTENLMMAAVLAEGATVLENAACEPEVVDLANALISMGAGRGAGTSFIRINSVASQPLDYRIISEDRDSDIYGCFRNYGGSVEIKEADQHVEPTLKLREAGIDVILENGKIIVHGRKRPGSIDIKTMPYRGFPQICRRSLWPNVCIGRH
jgi:UDP-N-acetylglucosamine 1-carboxyvinyltransferase